MPLQTRNSSNTGGGGPGGCAALVAVQMMLLQEVMTLSAASEGEVGIVFQLSTYLEDLVRDWGGEGAAKLVASRVCFGSIHSTLAQLSKSLLTPTAMSQCILEGVLPREKCGSLEDMEALESHHSPTQCDAFDSPSSPQPGGDATLVAPVDAHDPLPPNPPPCREAPRGRSTAESHSSSMSLSVGGATVPGHEKVSTGKSRRVHHHPFWSRTCNTDRAGAPPRGGEEGDGPTPSALLGVRQRLPAWSLRQDFLKLCGEHLVRKGMFFYTLMYCDVVWGCDMIYCYINMLRYNILMNKGYDIIYCYYHFCYYHHYIYGLEFTRCDVKRIDDCLYFCHTCVCVSTGVHCYWRDWLRVSEWIDGWVDGKCLRGHDLCTSDVVM